MSHHLKPTPHSLKHDFARAVCGHHDVPYTLISVDTESPPWSMKLVVSLPVSGRLPEFITIERVPSRLDHSADLPRVAILKNA
jgi:hypothetical protein